VSQSPELEECKVCGCEYPPIFEFGCPECFYTEPEPKVRRMRDYD
jgi:hypothetical protein